MSTPADLKYLIVDDFSTMRRIVKNLLQELGYSDITAGIRGQDDSGRRD